MPRVCPLKIAVLLSLGFGASAAETELYDLRKSSLGKAGPWSGDGIEVQLAPGKDGKLKFRLAELPEHEFLKFQFEMRVGESGGLGSIIVRGAQGDAAQESRERLKITSDGRTLLDSSFSSMQLGQSFPDAFGSFTHRPGTGSEKPEAADVKLPGGIKLLGAGADGETSNRYQFELLLPHSAPELVLDIAWLEEQPEAADGIEGMIIKMAGGMFGGGPSAPYSITGLRVQALDASPTPALDAARAKALLDDIAGDDPKVAHAAMQQLIGAGDAALPFVRERFAVVPDPQLAEKFEKAAAALRSDDFRERTKAEADLVGMGADVLPFIVEKLSAAGGERLTPDFRVGLEKVRKRLQEGAAVSSEQALANRLHHALGLFQSEAAKQARATLPPVRQLKPYVAPDQPDGFDADGFKFDFDF